MVRVCKHDQSMHYKQGCFRAGAVLIGGLLWAGACQAVFAASNVAHPRLFLNERRVSEIREAIQSPGTHHAEAYKALKSKVDEENFRLFGATEENWNYARSYLAQSAAFLYRITGDSRYSDLAFRTLKAVHENPGPDGRLPEEGYGLSRATVGLGFAIAYDWCYADWSMSQRRYIRDKITAALDAWPDYHHANFGHERASNWVAVCRGGELILLLSAGQEKERSERYEFLKQELIRHMRNGYDELGISQEGIGYTGYGGIFLLRAIYATESIGDEALAEEAANHAWWKQAMYAGTFGRIPSSHRLDGGRVFLMSGVGGPNINDEGWASLLLHSVPKDKLGYFKWWYDRHIGKKAVPLDDPSVKYDPARSGQVWALIYYPEDVKAQDPTGVFPKMVHGRSGMGYFRNRWQDPSDIVVNFTADQRRHSHAWDQAEATQIGLFAYNTLFIGGPGKERDPDYYSQLLVDGQVPSTDYTGELKAFESFKRGKDTGYAVLGGGNQYRRLAGITVRRDFFLQDAAFGENSLLMATADQIVSDRTHRYTWNANLGDVEGDWGIEVTKREENGVATFVMRGRSTGFVKGWVLAPKGAALTVADPLQIETRAASTDLVVAMAVGHGELPTIDIHQRNRYGVKAEIGDRTIAFDTEQGRLLSNASAREVSLEGRRRPLPVDGLSVEIVGDDRARLSWAKRDYGAKELVVERRKESGSFRKVRELAPDRTSWLDKQLEPSTSYTWRIVANAGKYHADPSSEVNATTWQHGYQLFIEDFSPRRGESIPTEHALGHWRFRNQDRGWKWREERGSPRHASNLAGYLGTGSVRIHHKNILFTDDVMADLSGKSARIAFDVQAQATTRFAPMLKIDGPGWIVGGKRHIHETDQWQQQAWKITNVEEWRRVDIESLATEEKVDMTNESLKQVQGIGIWAEWPINQKWAKVDQLHIRARKLEQHQGDSDGRDQP